MKHDQGRLNRFGLKQKAAGGSNLNADKGSVRAPVAVRAIIKLIEYYTSIAKHESVVALTKKLNKYLKATGASHRDRWLYGHSEPSTADIVDDGDYLCTESGIYLLTENGSYILVDLGGGEVPPDDPDDDGYYLCNEDMLLLLTEDNMFIELDINTAPPVDPPVDPPIDPPVQRVLADITLFNDFFADDDIPWAISGVFNSHYTHTLRLRSNGTLVKTISVGNTPSGFISLSAAEIGIIKGSLAVGTDNGIANLAVETFYDGVSAGIKSSSANVTVRGNVDPGGNRVLAKVTLFNDFFADEAFPWAISGLYDSRHNHKLTLRSNGYLVKSIMLNGLSSGSITLNSDEIAIVKSSLFFGGNQSSASLNVESFYDGVSFGNHALSAYITIRGDVDPPVGPDETYLATEGDEFMANESDLFFEIDA